MASEQHRARVKQARHEWQERRIPFMRRQPERLVFIDETSVKTNLTRLRGRARRGQRLRMDAPFGAWGTQTFIAGLGSDGTLPSAASIADAQKHFLNELANTNGVNAMGPGASVGSATISV